MAATALTGGAITLAACAAAAAALAGCGSDAPSEAKHPGAIRGNANNDPTFHYPRRSRVTIRDDGFHPERISVRGGTAVRWINRGTRTHTVEWVRGRSPRFRSGPIAPGQSYRFRVPRVARIVYRSSTPHGKRFRGVIEVG